MSARSCSNTILGSQASHLLLQLAHNYSLCLIGHLQYNHFQYHQMAANKGCTVVLHQSIFAACWRLSSWIVRPSSQDDTMPSSVAQSSVAAAALWRWDVSPMFWEAQRLLSSWSWAFQQAGARASCHKAVGWLAKGAWQKRHASANPLFWRSADSHYHNSTVSYSTLQHTLWQGPSPTWIHHVNRPTVVTVTQ